MAKLVTPSPEFFVDELYDSETSPSYTTRLTQKNNRPWLLFQLDKETSIIIPNRSGAGFESYSDYVVRTPEKDSNGHVPKNSHLEFSGFDIPQAVIVHGYEHRNLNDWEDLNPNQTDRIKELKAVIPDVKQKTKKFIENFSSFSKQTTDAAYIDELPKMFDLDFKIYSNAPIQFKQQYIPTKFTHTKENLDYPLPFNKYPQSIKEELSDYPTYAEKSEPFIDPNDSSNKFRTPITNVTPLQAKFLESLESQNSQQQFTLKSWLHNNISNEYSSVHNYITETREFIQNTWDNGKSEFDANPVDKKESRILNESAKSNIPGKRISALQDALEP